MHLENTVDTVETFPTMIKSGENADLSIKYDIHSLLVDT